jgi:hypothetical protein
VVSRRLPGWLSSRGNAFSVVSLKKSLDSARVLRQAIGGPLGSGERHDARRLVPRVERPPASVPVAGGIGRSAQEEQTQAERHEDEEWTEQAEAASGLLIHVAERFPLYRHGRALILDIGALLAQPLAPHVRLHVLRPRLVGRPLRLLCGLWRRTSRPSRARCLIKRLRARSSLERPCRRTVGMEPR